MPQPSTVDLVAPFDPTGYTSIDGAQLLQLVSGLVPYVDIGFNLWTSDTGVTPNVPNANTTTKWQTYTWMRITATAVIPYIWSPYANDVTFLGWVSLASSAIGIGTITGANIALNTIQDANIISLSYSKISGAPAGLPPSGAAGGVLTGTYPNPSIGNAQVTGAMIAAATIAGSNIAAGTILGSNIGASTIATGNIGPLAINFTTQIAPGTALQVLRTNAGATNIEGVTPLGSSAFGRLLQVVHAAVGTKQTTGGANLANITSAPAANATGMVSTTLSVAITPVSAASTLLIEVVVPLYQTTTGGACIALYNVAIGSGATAPLAIAGAKVTGGGNEIATTVVLKAFIAQGNTTPTTYYVGFGCDAGSAYVNSVDNTNVFFGLAQATIKIEEYL